MTSKRYWLLFAFAVIAVIVAVSVWPEPVDPSPSNPISSPAEVGSIDALIVSHANDGYEYDQYEVSSAEGVRQIAEILTGHPVWDVTRESDVRIQLIMTDRTGARVGVIIDSFNGMRVHFAGSSLGDSEYYFIDDSSCERLAQAIKENAANHVHLTSEDQLEYP